MRVCTYIETLASRPSLGKINSSYSFKYHMLTFYGADFYRFSVSKMNEEAKRSMTEWQEKLDKVTKDSEERISELQQKLAKVRKNIYQLQHTD